jgi:hypothetical protein
VGVTKKTCCASLKRPWEPKGRGAGGEECRDADASVRALERLVEGRARTYNPRVDPPLSLVSDVTLAVR